MVELWCGVVGLLGCELFVLIWLVFGVLLLVMLVSVFVGVYLFWVELGVEGYVLYSLRLKGWVVMLIVVNIDVGLFYGSFVWLCVV